MEQNVNRRGFIGAAIGTGAAAAMTPSIALGNGGHGHGHGHGGSGRVPRDRRGIQMWTVRTLATDQAGARRVLRALGAMGYANIEKFENYGWTVEQFRRELRAAGLRCISGHDGPGFPGPINESAYRATLEYAAKLGQKYTGIAWWPGPYDQEALWHQLADHLNQAAELADEYDLQFFYHNHDFEFLNRFGDRAAYDILLEETESNVKFQLDLFWVTEGGGNGVEYLSADPGRYVSYHVKDHVWGDRLNAPDFEDAGPGMLDFPDLFDAGDGRSGRYDKYFFIEHDEPELSHPGDPEAPLTTARVGIEYLEEVRW
jgi:sugar phosphate isomerase/epimerase